MISLFNQHLIFEEKAIMTNSKKVFLGGTCNDSTWREELKPLLAINFFDPIVPDWTEECMKEEIKQRSECDYVLYIITPRMTGVYSIAEVVDDSNKRPSKTIFGYLMNDGELTFTKAQVKSLTQVGKLVESNGGKFVTSLADAAKLLI